MTALRLGVAGLGTVGSTLAQLLEKNASSYAARLGRSVCITAVSAREAGKDRGFSMAGIAFEKDAVALAARDDVDVVVELIGGAEGTALDLAKAAIAHKKGFVTANKALLAYHGPALAEAVEAANTPFAFEAAVAGGIPVIKAVKEGLAANHISSVAGILNGTCNYILTEMADKGTAFQPVLKAAQDLGYAEADPTFDIEGLDAAHKTVILAMMAFGVCMDVDKASVTGISQIDSVDINYARELGLCIRLLGYAKKDAGWIDVGVAPTLVALSDPLAAITGPTNAVLIEADPVGKVVLEGPGAGGGATASAVLADIFDIARSGYAGGACAAPQGPVFCVPASRLMPIEAAPGDSVFNTYYMRLIVRDDLGVMAAIAHDLSVSGVSIDRLLQRGEAPDGCVYVVIITHRVTAENMDVAIKHLAARTAVIKTPTVLRVAGPMA